MNALNPWLNADEVRSVSQRLIAPASEETATIPEVGFDDAFVGFTDVESTPPPILTERDAFLAQLPKFQDWLVSKFSAKGVFLVDHEGDVVFDESSLDRLHFTARSLMISSKITGTCASHVRIKITSDSVLELIPADSSTQGKFVVGVLVAQALNLESIHEVVAKLVGGGIEGDQ